MDEMDFNQNEQNQEEEQARAAQEEARRQQAQREQQSEQQQMQQMQSSLSESQKEMDEQTEEEMEQSNEQEIDEGEQASEPESSEFSSGQQSQSQEVSSSKAQQESPSASTPETQQPGGDDISKQFQEQLNEAKENGLENGHDAESLQKQFDSMQNDIGNSGQKQMVKELQSRNEAFDEKGMSAYDGIEEKAQSIGRVGAERDLKAAGKRMMENPELGDKEAAGRMHVMKSYKQFTLDTGTNQDRKDVLKDLEDNKSQMEHERNVQSLDRSIEQIGSSLEPGEKSDKIEIGDDHYMEIAKGKDGKLDVMVDGKSVNDMEKESQGQEIQGQAAEGKEIESKSTETYSRDQTLQPDKSTKAMGMVGGTESYKERSDGSAEYSATYELDSKKFKDGPKSLDVKCVANKDGSYDLTTSNENGKQVTAHYPDKESFEKSVGGKMIENRVTNIQKNDPQSPLKQTSDIIKKGLESPTKENRANNTKAFEEYSKKPFTPQISAEGKKILEKNFVNKPESLLGKMVDQYTKAVNKGVKTIGNMAEKGAKAYGKAVTKFADTYVKTAEKGAKAVGETVEKGAKAVGKTAEKGAKMAGKIAKTLGGKTLQTAAMAIPGVREAVLVAKVANKAKSLGTQVKSMTYGPAQQKAKQCAEQSAQTI